MKSYFCMPARSAWPGRGAVSGDAVAPGAGDISSVHFFSHSLLAIWMATGEPRVRPWRTPARIVTSSCSKRMPRTAAVAQSTTGQLSPDVLDGDRESGGQALEHDHQGLAVGLPGGQEAQHRLRLLAPP